MYMHACTTAGCGGCSGDSASVAEAPPLLQKWSTTSAPSLGSLATLESGVFIGGSGGGSSSSCCCCCCSTSECTEFSADDQSDEPATPTTASTTAAIQPSPGQLPLLQLPQRPVQQQQQQQQQRQRKRSNAISAKSMSTYLCQYKEAKCTYFSGVLSGSLSVTGRGYVQGPGV